MREAFALIRANWLTALSYRMGMLMSIASLPAVVVPVYFVARALQPFIAASIDAQGGDYFGFLLVGMIALAFLTTAVTALPTTINTNISNGTLEALLATPIELPALLAGMIGYPFLRTAMRMLLLLLAGWVLGAGIAWERAVAATGILVLIVAAYLPFGLLSSAMILAFRTAGPLPQAVLLVSGLLGGVYYPTHVIPSWFQTISAAVPLTYGLRALRQVLLDHRPLVAVLPDVGILSGCVVVLFAAGTAGFAVALRYARRAGTLAQY